MTNVLDVGIGIARLVRAKIILKFVQGAKRILISQARVGHLFKKRFYITIFFLFILDTFTKQLALQFLTQGISTDFLPFIDLYLTYNSGVAFGFLDLGEKSISNTLTFIGFLITLYLFKLIKDESDYRKQFSLSFICGGAIGNIADRFMDGYVTDFLHLKINDFSFFVFNIADASITIGAVLLIYFEFFKKDHLSHETN